MYRELIHVQIRWKQLEKEASSSTIVLVICFRDNMLYLSYSIRTNHVYVDTFTWKFTLSCPPELCQMLCSARLMILMAACVCIFTRRSWKAIICNGFLDPEDHHLLPVHCTSEWHPLDTGGGRRTSTVLWELNSCSVPQHHCAQSWTTSARLSDKVQDFPPCFWWFLVSVC